MKTRAKTSKKNNVPKTSPASQAKESAPYENGLKKTFYIVGIDGSASSLEAFEEFFRNMPVSTRMALVLVTHLDPTHKALASWAGIAMETMSVDHE